MDKADRAKRRELNKRAWWGAITTSEQADHIIKTTAYGFYFLAFLQGAIGYLIAGPSVLFDAALMVLFAFFLQKTKKSLFAYLLLALMVIGLVITFSNRFNFSDAGGQNIFLSIIFVWASIRAVQATSFLAKNKVSPQEN